MKIYEMGMEEDVVDAIIQMIEKETESKIFTIKILNDVKEGLESLVVFEDKSVMMALISVQTIGGKLACRFRGNYI